MSFIFIPDIQAHQLELNRPRNQATPTRMHLFRSPVYAWCILQFHMSEERPTFTYYIPKKKKKGRKRLTSYEDHLADHACEPPGEPKLEATSKRINNSARQSTNNMHDYLSTTSFLPHPNSRSALILEKREYTMISQGTQKHRNPVDATMCYCRI